MLADQSLANIKLTKHIKSFPTCMKNINPFLSPIYYIHILFIDLFRFTDDRLLLSIYVFYFYALIHFNFHPRTHIIKRLVFTQSNKCLNQCSEWVFYKYKRCRHCGIINDQTNGINQTIWLVILTFMSVILAENKNTVFQLIFLFSKICLWFEHWTFEWRKKIFRFIWMAFICRSDVVVLLFISTRHFH